MIAAVVVIGLCLVSAGVRALCRVAAARALRAAADDYSVNFGTMTPWQIRAWLRARGAR